MTMKSLILSWTMLQLIALSAFCQNGYPKVEVTPAGDTLIVLTSQQTKQLLSAGYERDYLLQVVDVKDSVIFSKDIYIQALERSNTKMDSVLRKYEGLINLKDANIASLKDEIDLHLSAVKRQKRRKIWGTGSGIIIGLATGVITGFVLAR